MRLLVAVLLFLGVVTSAAAQNAPQRTEVEPLRNGDTIQISVWQDPKLDRQVVVGPDGMISFPLAGHVHAGGMTPQALENLLRSRLQKNYTSRLDVTVSLAAVNKDEEAQTKPRVFVTGEVLKPGPYLIRPSSSVMEAIALAGGLGPFAATHRIQVHRQVAGADTILLFDYNAYQAGKKAADNINLRSGDIIIVPERGLLDRGLFE